jgi:hypothetical protein
MGREFVRIIWLIIILRHDTSLAPSPHKPGAFAYAVENSADLTL